MAREYIARNSASHSTAITILQVVAPATSPVEIVRAWISQRGSTTSAQEVIQIVRKSAAATVTSLTPVKLDPNDAAFAGTAGHTATAEGTDTDVLIREGFNVLNGWLYLPVPEERIRIPPSGIIGLKFSTAPAAQNWEYGFVIQEL